MDLSFIYWWLGSKFPSFFFIIFLFFKFWMAVCQYLSKALKMCIKYDPLITVFRMYPREIIAQILTNIYLFENCFVAFFILVAI